jgi:hypothetical protein
VRLATAAIAMVAVSVAGCTAVEKTPPVILKQSVATMSAGQFDTLVSRIEWRDGWTRKRCTSAACTDSVPVHIEASAGSYTIDSLNGGLEGTIVARVQNTGKATTYMYHFKPAPYRYYFLVKRSGAGSRWVLLEQQGHLKPDSVDSGHFTGCWDHRPAESARADFRNCGPRKFADAGEASRMAAFASPAEAFAAPTSRQTYTEAGAWIGCKYGCCPMGYTY